MAQKKETKRINVQNKKARFDYVLLKTFEAGAELFGHEVKAIRNGKASLVGSHVVIRDNEAYLVGASISHYQKANTPKEYDAYRVRKLLLHKKELAELAKTESTKGLTIVPLKWYNNNRRLKLEVAIAKGKKAHDKRESLKTKDSNRAIERTLKTQ